VTGPTGLSVVAFKSSASTCEDALEIVAAAQNEFLTIATNQETWWGAAFPHPAETTTETNADEIPPFSLLKDSNDFDILYVFGDNFSADLCGRQSSTLLSRRVVARHGLGWIRITIPERAPMSLDRHLRLVLTIN